MSSTMKLANGDSAPYWDAAKEGRLVFKECKSCGRKHFPPRYLCPTCWSEDLKWVRHSGGGAVHSFTIVHRAPTKWHAAKVPYVLAAVDMDDAPRLIANVVGSGALTVKIGDRVEVCFEDRDGTFMPQFRRVQDAA